MTKSNNSERDTLQCNDIHMQHVHCHKKLKIAKIKTNNIKAKKIYMCQTDGNNLSVDNLEVNCDTKIMGTTTLQGTLNIGGPNSIVNFIDGNTYVFASEDKAIVAAGFTDAQAGGVNRVIQSIQMYNFILTFTTTVAIPANTPTLFATLVGGDIPLATTYGIAVSGLNYGWFTAEAQTGVIIITFPVPLVIGNTISINHVYLTQ
jgi:hypothetical protein